MEASKATGRLDPELAHQCFHDILLANASQKANPDSMDEEIDSSN